MRDVRRRRPGADEDAAQRQKRNYGTTVKTRLHLPGKQGLLKRVDRKAWLPVDMKQQK